MDASLIENQKDFGEMLAQHPLAQNVPLALVRLDQALEHARKAKELVLDDRSVGVAEPEEVSSLNRRNISPSLSWCKSFGETQPLDETDQLLFGISFQLRRAVGVKAVQLAGVSALNSYPESDPHANSGGVRRPRGVLDASTSVVFTKSIELMIQVALVPIHGL
jgi:hypothetical protein